MQVRSNAEVAVKELAEQIGAAYYEHSELINESSDLFAFGPMPARRLFHRDWIARKRPLVGTVTRPVPVIRSALSGGRFVPVPVIRRAG